MRISALVPVTEKPPGCDRLQSPHASSRLLDDTLHCIACVGAPCLKAFRSVSLRPFFRNKYLGVVLTLLVASMAPAGEAMLEQATFSIRPKVGVLLPFAGEWNDAFDEHFHGELGLKGTLDNWGLELSGGAFYGKETITGNDYSSVNGILKLTGTYEFNPLAARPGHDSPLNLYLGCGVGYYPSELSASLTIDGIVVPGKQSYSGWGPHGVIGGEYFLGETIGFFAEAQYTFTMFQIDAELRGLRLHAFSLLAGVAFRF